MSIAKNAGEDAGFQMNGYLTKLERMVPFHISGQVCRIVGTTAYVQSFPAALGSLCRIHRDYGEPIEAEVVGIQADSAVLLAYDELVGIRQGHRVELISSEPAIHVGDGLLGRVIDSRGRLIDQRPAVPLPDIAPVRSKPVAALNRPRIDSVLATGIRVIDGLLTLGQGQRLGIFAGSGVGKSTLMGSLARSSSADVNVVALVGERGREVREFIERDLGAEGLSRSVIVVATGDEPALLRLRAAWVATAIAEYFRDRGKNVLLMMDSVTRFALAQREIGLAAGEPPATRGFPPSVFAELPRLLERSGRTAKGSITGLYTVLVEGDDTNEPISDSVRGILDGHLVLSRSLAHEAHWPAVDVLESISRSMNDIVQPDHLQAAHAVRQLMAAWKRSKDLIDVGAYEAGSDPLTDVAITAQPAIRKFLTQGTVESSPSEETTAALKQLASLLPVGVGTSAAA